MPAPTAETLQEALRPLTSDPGKAALFLDVDGTLAPIVKRPEEAHVSEKASRLLGQLGRRFGLVACVSGRPAAEARRLVGVGSIVYAGSHGAEVLEKGASRAEVLPAFATWSGRVHRFAGQQADKELRLLRIRIEDKGPIVAFHWRGVPDEAAARTKLEGVAMEAETAGLSAHWGRKVLELRPPVQVSKGRAVRELLARRELRRALFAGDDVTDLDGFDALEDLAREGRLEAIVRVGVRSDEGPMEIVERAEIVVDGVSGVAQVLEALAEAP